MKTPLNNAQYKQRFDKVIDYIYQHMDQPLDLFVLADIACVSPYHWHRMYRGLYGETPAQTIKRLRLQRAAKSLVNNQLPMEKIAEAAGYTTVQAFNRAFSSGFGITPAAYRKRGLLENRDIIQSPNPLPGGVMKNVEIKSMDNFQVIGIPHQGDYMDVGKAFEKYYGWMAMNKLFGQPVRSIGIYYDDPASTATEELRSLAGSSMPDIEDGTDTQGLEVVDIPAGEYAVFRHTGSYAELEQSYSWLYSQWLPQSGREPADSPCYEEYLNNARDTAPADLLTDIYVPLK